MFREKIVKLIKKTYKALYKTPLVYAMSATYIAVDALQYRYFDHKWKRNGYALPTEEEQKLVRKNVTFIYKSFERQKLAKRLFRSIQDYYSGVKVIIADDSRKPLVIDDPNVSIIQLPFNSGLSRGLQAALDQVNTPYTIRMDDDQLLTRRTCFYKQLQFLMDHPEVDLSGVLQFTTPVPKEPEDAATEFYESTVHKFIWLKIPHMTKIDEHHIVVGKSSNVFVCRTEKLKEVSYDENIRMIDHLDFFLRAARKSMVSVLDNSCLVHHSHNRFHKYYQKFRGDFQGDQQYISKRGY